MALLAVGLAACGNGVPVGPDAGVAGGACTTNDDCGAGEICSDTLCVALDPGDGGPLDGGSADGGQVCTTDTWGNFAENIIVTQCLSCHDHFHNFSDSYSSVRNNRTSMRTDIRNGSMPRSPQSLSTSDRARIVKWFDCGLPQ